MIRRLLTITTALSLLACLATTVLWVRTSLGHGINWWFVDNPRHLGNVRVHNGRVLVTFVLVMEVTYFDNSI